MKVTVPLTLTTSRLIAIDACRPSDVGVWLSVNCALEMLKPPMLMSSEPVSVVEGWPLIIVNWPAMLTSAISATSSCALPETLSLPPWLDAATVTCSRNPPMSSCPAPLNEKSPFDWNSPWMLAISFVLCGTRSICAATDA